MQRYDKTTTVTTCISTNAYYWMGGFRRSKLGGNAPISPYAKRPGKELIFSEAFSCWYHVPFPWQPPAPGCQGKEFWKNQFKAALNLVPGVGGALAQELQNYEDFRLAEFFRKFTSFILELTEVSADDRVKFANEVQEKAEDMAGNVISGMVDRLDNINKEKILASLTKVVDEALQWENY